jgi:hypothetical protein
VRNGAVVEFSPSLTECLGCNTAAYLLGSEEQARATALFYLVKYMVKDSVSLGNSLPVIREAMKHVNRYESNAGDAGSDSRTSKFFMQRIVNGFTGLAEISDTQCAACLLGMRSMVSTDGHWFAFIKAAAAFQQETHTALVANGSDLNSNTAWGDDSDFEDPAASDQGDSGVCASNVNDDIHDDILDNMDEWAGLGAGDEISEGLEEHRYSRLGIIAYLYHSTLTTDSGEKSLNA